jgi:hypothetical protein
LDQARGIVGLFYVLSIITSSVDGDILRKLVPYHPTYLNHGYAYYKGDPSIITLIDVGQLMFMFIMGFVAYIAFSSRLEKRGAASAWLYAARRFAGLYILSIVGATLLPMLRGQTVNWNEALYDGVLSRLAIGGLAAYTAVYFVRNADRRAWLGFTLFAVHAFLFASYYFDRYPWIDDMLQRPKFPFGVFNLAAIAILGSAFAQWFAMRPDDPGAGIRSRILPVATWSLVAAYCVEWIQPSEHHDVTTALALLSIGLTGYLVMASYAMGTQGIVVPALRAIGKNLLLVFIVTGEIVDMYLEAIADTAVETHPYAALLFVGLLPVAAVAYIALLLEKRNIVVRL